MVIFESVWVLSICAGISWLGCGSISKTEYPSEVSCYKALEAMKSAYQIAAEAKYPIIAVCSPKKK